MKREKRQAAEARLAAFALLVTRGQRDAYLVDGSCATLGEERVLEVIKREQQYLLLVRLGSADLIIASREALTRKLARLREQGLANAPFLVSVDAAPGKASEPRLLDESEVGAVTACLLTATAGWLPSSSSVMELELNEEGQVERVVGYPFIAGWLLGYPCIYHSTTTGANLLSMQRLVKFSISGARREGDEGTGGWRERLWDWTCSAHCGAIKSPSDFATAISAAESKSWLECTDRDCSKKVDGRSFREAIRVGEPPLPIKDLGETEPPTLR